MLQHFYKIFIFSCGWSQSHILLFYFILWGKSVPTRMHIWWLATWNQGNTMINLTTRGGNPSSLRPITTNRGKFSMGVTIQNLDNIELGNTSKLAFLQKIFHMVSANNLWGSKLEPLEGVFMDLFIVLSIFPFLRDYKLICS